MKSASSSGQQLLAEQKAAGQRRLQVTRWVLGMVIMLAVVAASALWFTVSQARVLARPNHYSDIWQVSSINSELARVGVLSHRALAGEAGHDALLMRLDVLYSLLDQSTDSPRVQTQIHDLDPATSQTLHELQASVEEWALLLQRDPSPTGLRQVMEGAERYGDRVSKALAEVHLVTTLQADQHRVQLLQRFVMLSVALVLLLLGAAIGIWRVLKDREIAVQTSRTLNEINQTLETRVRERTRQNDEARNLLTFILDASPSDVVLLDAVDGQVHYINRRLIESLGMRQRPQQLSLSELLHDPKAANVMTRTLNESGQIDGFEALIAAQPPYWSSLSAQLIEVEGRLCHLIWGFDVSTHKRLENELRVLATTDLLSGLNNRRAFLEKGAAVLEHCRRYHTPCGVLMIDIDLFKSINDRYGHPVGDEAIRSAGQAIQRALRDADVVGRMGGEEFAVLLPHADPQGLRDTAERIRESVASIAMPLPNGDTLCFTVSLGMATFVPPNQTLEHLLVQADHALYRAKAAGRNRAIAYSAEKLDL